MQMHNYFSHDSNARNADNILSLRMRMGAEGYGIYFMILERLREEPDYSSVKDYNMLAFDFRVGSDKVKTVVEDFGLFHFTGNGERFYSESLLRRMQIKDEKTEKAKAAAAKRWEKTRLNSPSDAIALPSHLEIAADKEKKSKEQPASVEAARTATAERKEQFMADLAEYTPQYGSEVIREFGDYWTEMTPSGLRMRFELEKTWETSRRLATWLRRKEEAGRTNRNNNDSLRKDAETIGRTERRSTTL